MFISEASIKKLKGLCHFHVFDFWMTWCDCSSASSNHPQQRQCQNMSLWLFCGRGISFVHYLFNPTISIHYTTVFVSEITRWNGSFVCFGDSFIMPFTYLVYIFYTNIVHFNRIAIKHFMWSIRFWKVLFQ